MILHYWGNIGYHDGHGDDTYAGYASNSAAKSYYMGGCQNYDPFLGTLNIRCRIIIGTQKGTIILTIPHMNHMEKKKENSMEPGSIAAIYVEAVMP